MLFSKNPHLSSTSRTFEEVHLSSITSPIYKIPINFIRKHQYRLQPFLIFSTQPTFSLFLSPAVLKNDLLTIVTFMAVWQCMCECVCASVSDNKVKCDKIKLQHVSHLNMTLTMFETWWERERPIYLSTIYWTLVWKKSYWVVEQNSRLKRTEQKWGEVWSEWYWNTFAWLVISYFCYPLDAKLFVLLPLLLFMIMVMVMANMSVTSLSFVAVIVHVSELLSHPHRFQQNNNNNWRRRRSPQVFTEPAAAKALWCRKLKVFKCQRGVNKKDKMKANEKIERHRRTSFHRKVCALKAIQIGLQWQ